ncbi:hydrolase [Salimicrobium halophilum]|uniref:Hydrolase n=1 Tax=Salimicrobium halophilum TaxID=86666 RepID=A0A1G8VC77_9BACI|nr:hydrolase [Salimicrobium halophilum]SDJ63514.1 hypothetical protein SAMN04490247_2635 [Salimicrobium halophilum]
MERKKYFVNMGTREISVNHDANNDDFVIHATEEEVLELREMFDEMQNADERSFFRSHIPFVPYHKDLPNDEYDDLMEWAFTLVHDLGDEETKSTIEGMGVLKK